MQPQQKYQSQSSNKQFDRKTVVGFLITAGLMGLFVSLVYRPLLTWSPIIPPVFVEVTDTVYFDVNSTDIRVEAWEVLDRIAKNNAGKIVITGGADSTGNTLDNWKLSQARSKSIREMLISLKVSPDSILAIAFGDRRPISQAVRYNRYTIIKWNKQQ